MPEDVAHLENGLVFMAVASIPAASMGSAAGAGAALPALELVVNRLLTSIWVPSLNSIVAMARKTSSGHQTAPSVQALPARALTQRAPIVDKDAMIDQWARLLRAPACAITANCRRCAGVPQLVTVAATATASASALFPLLGMCVRRRPCH